MNYIYMGYDPCPTDEELGYDDADDADDADDEIDDYSSDEDGDLAAAQWLDWRMR